MDTLHKKLSEIRDLRAEELDLIGGAEDEQFPPYHGGHPTFSTFQYNTSSLQPAGPGNYAYQTDDATVQTQQTDWVDNP